jgi:hypothetical protein
VPLLWIKSLPRCLRRLTLGTVVGAEEEEEDERNGENIIMRAHNVHYKDARSNQQ